MTMPVRARPDPSRFPALLIGWLSLLMAHVAGAAPTPAGNATRFNLYSPDLTAGGWVPRGRVYDHGCHGRNQSPALAWHHEPAGTRSLAVLVYDSDARGGWWHWLVIDIPAAVHALPAGAGTPGAPGLPAGAVQTRNDFGFHGYGGPCPPPGPAHHYHFYLYALRVPRVAIAASAPPGAVAAAVRAAAIAEAEITVRYGRGRPSVAQGRPRG
jgi:hypothetical protein